MDNLTHSLFGAAAAEAYLQRKYPKNPVPPRAALYITSIVANNFTDLDLLFGLIDNSPLGYLLNHRGWTHTVLGSLAQSLMLIGLIELWMKFFAPRLIQYKRDIWILALLGSQTHMLLDFFNSYGVHPLWPLSTDWYYLDSIFIIEPLLWIALVPIWLRPKSTSWLLLVPIFLAYSYGVSRNLVSTSALVGATACFFFCFWFYGKIQPKHKALVALTTFFLIVGTFWAHQKIARNQIRFELAKVSKMNTLDVVLSSLPSNPTCWFFITPQVSDSEYRVLAGTVALYGGNPSTCLSWPLGSGLTTNTPPPESTSSNISFRGAWSASLEELRPLLTRCNVLSWFKFARVPIWQNNRLNDLRFASRNENNFTTFDASASVQDHCPPVSAPWNPPRSDLLDFIKTRDSLGDEP